MLTNIHHHLQHKNLYLSIQMSQVIVVGGGLAGLSAAHTLLERGANVLLLDKQGCVSSVSSRAPVFNYFFSDSWVVTPQKPHPVSTVLAQILRRHWIFLIPLKSSSTIPRNQYVFLSPTCLSSQTFYRPATLLVMTSLKSLLGALEMP